MDRAKTLVLGMGNPILGDDGVGIEVARRIRGKVGGSVDVVEVSASGLELLDVICGYEDLIIVDSIQTEDGKVGELHRLDCSDFSPMVRPSLRHQMNLATVLELGKRLQLGVPNRITIYAVAIEEATDFREGCTPAVEKAIPEAVEAIIAREGLGVEGRSSC